MILGGSYKYPMKNCRRTATLHPAVGLRCKIPLRHLSQLKARPIPLTLCISHITLSKDGKVLSHLRFTSKVLPGPLTDLCTWVEFCTSSPQQVVKYHLWYLDLGGAMHIPWTITKGRQSSFPLGFKSICRSSVIFHGIFIGSPKILISKLICDTLMWAWGAESHPVT
jgi:hypothetical protein